MKTARLSILACAAIGLSALAQPVAPGVYSASARLDLERRVRRALAAAPAQSSVAGTVTVVADGAFFVQRNGEALKVVIDHGVPPASGDVVEVRCRPALEGGRVVALAKSWKKTGRAPLPSPRKVTANDLLFVPAEARDAARDVNGLLVEARGRAMALTESGFAIDVDGLPVTVAVDDPPAFVDSCDKTHPICRVTGVAELILDQSVLFGRSRQVMGVKLHALSPDAITLEYDPVYLVNCRDRRVMWLVGALIAALALGVVALLAFIYRLGRRQMRTKTLMNERKRMADDIHDTIEQHLVGAGMLMQLGKTKEAREILIRAKKEIRDIVWGLKNDDMMRLSPTEMIRELAHEEAKKGLCRVTARIEWLPETLDASRMRDLSLIVREAIGNAVKHGGAKKIAITADSKPDGGWLLRIANDGAPFDAAHSPGVAEGHFGLEGMRERGRRLGADVAISTKGAWTTVAVDAKGKA